MKKFLLLVCFLFLYYSVGLITSCSKCSDGAGPGYYRLTGLQEQVLKISVPTSSSVSTPTFSLDTDISATDYLPYDSLGIHIYYTLELMALQKENSLFFTEAYACSPAPPRYDEITHLSIIASDDYNEAFPQGEDLSPIVDVRIGHFVDNAFYEVSPDYYNTNYVSEAYGANERLLTFSVPPAVDKTMNLTVTFSLKDGRDIAVGIRDLKIAK